MAVCLNYSTTSATWIIESQQRVRELDHAVALNLSKSNCAVQIVE